MVRSTRSSYSCARCYKRKKKCDRAFPSCSQCLSAKAQCIGLDRGSEAELPRSLVSYLEQLAAQLEVERDSLLRDRAQSGVTIPRSDLSQALVDSPSSAVSSVEVAAAYSWSASTARNCTPAASVDTNPRYALPYHRAFFLGAELPFPLAFQECCLANVPSSHGAAHFTQLPADVADKLLAIYVERILPQYPIFLKSEISGMYERFKMAGEAVRTVTAEEQFIISMVMAIVTLSSRARDYRKLVSVAESLRRDAFTYFDFAISSNRATITTIQQFLLLAQYGYLLPSSTNLWQVVGDASRIALELGLHQETRIESGLDENAMELRKRLYWTLYAIERSVAITSHRPFAVAGDQIHLPFPCSQDDPNFPEPSPDQRPNPISNQSFAQVPYIRFVDRLQFLRVQAEVCSVNIGMRPIPSPHLTYGDWMIDVERRIFEAMVRVATPKWCAFMEWHSILLLHMPCARNPNPDENSVLRYFDAAVQMANGYWELIEANSLDFTWHATHHCYESGNLILYGLWYYRALIQSSYTTAQIFEVVHRISAVFILLMKQWPAAQHCSLLFDRLRGGALRFFSEEGDSDDQPCLEARQLKDLVFRENADLLYAREQPLDTTAQFTPGAMFTSLDIDHVSLVNDTDFLGSFNFSTTPIFDGFDQVTMDDENELPVGTGFQRPAEDATLPGQQAKVVVDETQLKTALEMLPVCSPCKKRRIRCDLNLPACRNCARLHRDCSYRDNALAKETSRKHVYALKQHVETLTNEIKRLQQQQALQPTATVSNPVAGTSLVATVRSEVRSNDQLHMQILSNILCRAPSDDTSSPNLMYFGTTSSFAFLARNLGKSIPLPERATTPAPQSPKMLNTLCDSLTLNVVANMSRSDAQNLAWFYYRSIELTYPILGQDLISETLDHIYSGNPETSDHNTMQTRFNFMLAIALALLSAHDQRLQLFADSYLREAISHGISSDQFIHPTNQSLQMMLLLCIYAWVCPSAMDVWRLLGHASRMCLDIIEMHGSNKTDSAYTGVLYRTLYNLETEISISFGRPHQLPDGKEVPEYSSDPSSAGADELSTMVYSLARLQNRFHRDVISSNGNSSAQGAADLPLNNAQWMATCVHDITVWIDDWNSRLDALFDASLGPQGESTLKSHLRLYGKFQQCSALLLAKVATDLRGQAIISSEANLTACKVLLQTVNSLQQASTLQTGVLLSGGVDFALPLTWTRAHAVFTAAVMLLQHMHNTSEPFEELERSFRVGLEILMSIERTSDQGITGFVDCIRNLAKSSHLFGRLLP